MLVLHSSEWVADIHGLISAAGLRGPIFFIEMDQGIVLQVGLLGILSSILALWFY